MVLSDRLQGLDGVEPPLMVWSGGKKLGGPTGENHREVAVETLTEKASQPKRVGK